MTDHELESTPSAEAAPGDQEPGGLARFLRGALRLSLVGLIGLFVGVGLYLGVPAIIRAAVEPVEENRARIIELEERLDRLAREQEAERSRLAEELAAVRGDVTQLGERLSELGSRTMALEEDIQQLDAQRRELAQLEDELVEVNTQLASLERQLAQLEADQAAPRQRLQDLDAELRRVRAMHLIVQAQAAIDQGEMRSARLAIEAAFVDLTAGQDLAVNPVVQRLELALKALSTNPDAADRDLQTAWELLVSATELAPTPTPSPSPTQADNEGESP